jgi:uncharacterized protein YbjT (DUF2867 family)
MVLVTVFGGTGFLGRRIVERLAGAGEIVRVAARHPARGGTGALSAGPGRAVPIAADIRDENSVAAAVAGADCVVNAVSAYVETGGVTYPAVHVRGAANLAQACTRQKVGRLVHLSGIGADATSPSPYIRARGEGEREVRQAFAQATVLRPSVMFAADDGFLTALAALAKSSPVIPLIGGGRTRLQPVHADDVALAACAALRDPAAPGATYELGGAESFTLRDIVGMILARTRRRRLLVPIPFDLAHPLARLLENLPRSPLTVAQVDLLRADNVPAPGAPGLAELGIVARRIQEAIAASKWRSGS